MADERLGSRALWWLAGSLLILVLDQYTKALVVDQLELYQRISVLPVFDIVRLHNTGAAFSLFADAGGWQNNAFISLGLVVTIILLIWLWRLPSKGAAVQALALSLVIGGALGNIVDRINHGYVVDFLLFYYRDWSYPAFNVADSAITCGAILMVFDALVLERRRNNQAR